MTSTDWDAYDVPELAGIVNEDLTEGWNHVWAWTLATDMLNAARDELETARASLAAVWTAEKSPAAQEFFTFVEAVSESMAATAEAATANRTAMQQVLDSQAETRAAVNDLHSSWQSWSRDVRVSTDPFDQADAESVLNDLNTRAAAHMTAADLVITDATEALVVPPVFEQNLSIDRYTRIPGSDGTPFGGEGGPDSARSPAGVSDWGAPGMPTSAGTAGGSPTGVETGGNLPSPDPLGRSPSETSRATGSLGSARNRAEPSRTPLESGSTSVGLDEGAGLPPSGAFVGGAYPGGGSRVGGLRGRPSIVDQAHGPWQARPGASGTVQPGPAGNIGYVDGSPVAAGRAAGVPGSSGPANDAVVPPMIGGGGGWTGSRSNRRANGSTAWDVPTGVPAILVPAIESEIHDPGPGVIGIDR